MIFKRTHWAWSVDWDEWDPDGYNALRGDERGRWKWNSIHFGDYERAMAKWDEVKARPPGAVRNICLNRRPVGAPETYLKSS